MAAEDESLRVILARIDENVRSLKERAEEDRDHNDRRFTAHEQRFVPLEDFRSRSLGIIAVLVLVGGWIVSEVKDAFAAVWPH